MEVDRVLVILEKSVMVVKTNVGDETSLLEKKMERR